MLSKTVKEKQYNLLSSIPSLCHESARKVINNDMHWHNQFYKEVFCSIDESIFDVLFCKDNGAPSASPAEMVSMMILKEGFRFSDKILFESVTFHVLFRMAIGKVNMDDKIITPATYYNFRKRIMNYHTETGIDLLDICFQRITSSQVLKFNVDGSELRMDSKLFGSNISNNSRYDIIATVLQKFVLMLNNQARKRLSLQDKALVKEIKNEDISNTVFLNSSDYIKERLIKFGLLIYNILSKYKDYENTEEFKLLRRVFNEQYTVVVKDNNNDDGDSSQKEETQKITLNDKVSTQSVQSPNDTDCTFRIKNKKSVKGYSVNVTETVAKTKKDISLITDIQVENASHADCKFLEKSIERSKEVTNQKPDSVYSDGAYSSDHKVDPSIDLVFTGIQGKQGRYKLEKTSNGLKVTDTLNNITHIANLTKVAKDKKYEKYCIVNKEGKRVYFDEDAIRAAEFRRKLNGRSREELNKRNNVEATIYMIGYPLQNGKSKYRGLQKQRMWVACRALWVNLLRIKSFVGSIHPEPLIISQKQLKSLNNFVDLAILGLMNLLRIEYSTPRVNSIRNTPFSRRKLLGFF